MSQPCFLGLDVGLSTTDVVADWAPRRSVSVPTGAPRDTASAAVDRFLGESPPPAGHSVTIAATGYGSHHLSEALCGFPLRKIPELEAIGRGGTGVAGVRDGLVVSLGTGTAMVSVRGAEMNHVSPGTGVGGGTLFGFARTLGIEDLGTFARLAGAGDRRRVDLTLGEVLGGPLGVLPPETTASNLGKPGSDVRREDLAAGLVNLVAEVVLAISFLGLQVSGQSRAILTGKLLAFEPIARRIAELPEGLQSFYVVPAEAGVATALGAMWMAGELP